jgi:hypothetical protein
MKKPVQEAVATGGASDALFAQRRSRLVFFARCCHCATLAAKAWTLDEKNSVNDDITELRWLIAQKCVNMMGNIG